MRIAITGATGLIGRNLLFEIIKQNLKSLDDLKIFVLGRSKCNIDIQKRIKKIIQEDGLFYLSLNKKEEDRVLDYCDVGIRGINIDLDAGKLGLTTDGIKELNESPIDIFFHLAAMTDLRHSSVIAKALIKTNVIGTQQILGLLTSLKKIGDFCYVGTAYSCGTVAGEVQPDSIVLNQKFRNPYERTKFEAEVLVRNFAKKTGVRCRYFRPSVTCGRLIEQPLGAVPKFNVFYGWAALLFQIKLKQLKDSDDKYKKILKLDMRIRYSLKSGLNIVPADYAAKVMYQVCIQNAPGDSYHLVNNRETPHNLYIPITFDTLNIKGLRHVDVIPGDMNKFESLYYKTAGKVFTSYVISDPMLFSTKNIDKILDKAKLHCPPVDEKTFPILMDFAKKHNFGLDINEPVANNS